MVSKKDFKEYIRKAQEFDEYLNKLADVGLQVWEQEEVGYFRDAYDRMLVELIGKEHEEDFYYFSCEMEYGNNRHAYLEDKDGNRVDVFDADDFWEFINGNYNYPTED